MPTRRVAWLLLALSGCGLGVVGIGVGSDAGPGGAPNDGGVARDAPGDPELGSDGHAADGGGEGGVGEKVGDVDDAGCTLLVRDDFSSPDPRWQPTNDARFEAGAAVLVLPGEQHHGGIFLKLPPSSAPPTSLEASFTMLTAPKGDAAIGDGIMLVWSADEGTPHLGGTGGQMGFCPDGNSQGKGPNGAAVAFHASWPIGISPRESDGGSCIVPQNVSMFTFGASHRFTTTVTGQKIRVESAGSVSELAINTSIPIRWVGFTAATGGAIATFAVDDVRIKICP